MSTFGEKLKQLRKKQKITQKELANSLNVTQTAVNYWENDKREPSMDMQKKIAKIFDVALYALIDDDYDVSVITSWEYRARVLDDTEMKERPRPFTIPYTPQKADKTRNNYEQLQDAYKRLNDNGQEKVIEYAEDLSKIPTYQSNPAPPDGSSLTE